MNKTELSQAIAEGLTMHEATKASSNYVDDTYAHLVGKIVALRTVTMTNVGRLEAVMPQGFLITDAVWIANTGRWANFCRTGDADEVEPFGDKPVIVAKGGLIDVVELPKIPKAKN